MADLPDIPKSWLVLALLIALVVLRAIGFDTWSTAAISSIAGYIMGAHIQATKADL